MQPYLMNRDELLQRFETDLENGLSAGKIIEKKGGLKSGLGTIGAVVRYLRSKLYYINVITLLAYVLALIFSCLNQAWPVFYLTVGAIVVSLILYFSEGALLLWYRNKYERMINENQPKMLAIRGGKKTLLSPDELLVGDLIEVEPGTVLTADARVISCEHLFADESFVFERTISSEKTAAPLAERNLPAVEQKNMLYKGSSVSSGQGRCIVTALNEDCYIAKVGKRIERKQRSLFYNRQNNIGRIASFIYIILLAFGLLISVVFTNRYVEAFSILGVMSSLFALNPVSALMEWTYYRTAEKLYAKGALIRSIDAFDGMNREDVVYFDIEKLLDGLVTYSHTIPLRGTEKNSLSYFTLCMGNSYLSEAVSVALKRYDLDFEQLSYNYPVFRRENDGNGISSSLFSNDGKTIVVSAGYWQKMLPLFSAFENDLIAQINELEKRNKYVMILASSAMDFIPNRLTSESLNGQMEAVSILVFDIPVSGNLLNMIHQLKHSHVKVSLINRYSDELGAAVASSYDMECSGAAPQKQCYTLPHLKGQLLAVSDTRPPIEKEQAKLVVSAGISPQEVVYQVKCMFCGIRRCLNFIATFGILLLLTVPSLFLAEIPLEKLVIPSLSMGLMLTFPCYFIIESVNNCTKHRRSLLLGFFAGVTGFAAAIFGIEMALFTAELSVLLLGLYMLIRCLINGKVQKLHWIALAILFVICVLPWFFMGGEWIPAILLALFAPAGIILLDFLY